MQWPRASRDPDRSRAERAARPDHQRTGKRLHGANRADRRGPDDRTPHTRAARARSGVGHGGCDGRRPSAAKRGGVMRPETGHLSTEELRRVHASWRAANYLSVGQIYLYDNPLLKEPLRRGHIKPRLLGHWGTTPGLNLLYVHLNRVIKKHDLDMIYVIGPGHGGP